MYLQPYKSLIMSYAIQAKFEKISDYEKIKRSEIIKKLVLRMVKLQEGLLFTDEIHINLTRSFSPIYEMV